MNAISSFHVALIIPTWNASKDLPFLLPSIFQQTIQPNTILFIDSHSTDNTRELLKQHPVNVHTILQKEFDHGGTRQLATSLVDADVYVFMTQDAYLASPHALEKLIKALISDDKIACTYGRQLPKLDANPLGACGRFFNYPEHSVTRFMEDKHQYGIKTCFNSNNLAAYKKTVLDQVGGFPRKLMTAEDVYVAAKCLEKGYGIRYVSDALVYHSHNLTMKQEFHRYFSVGVFHGREQWIIQTFKSANGEGWRYLKAELSYLKKNKLYQWIPRSLLSTFSKFVGYHLGLRERFLPLFIKKHWGVNKSFW